MSLLLNPHRFGFSLASVGWEMFVEVSAISSPPADGTAVQNWTGDIGAGHTPTQATAGNRPLYRTAPTGFNSLPALEFASSDFFQVAYTSALNPAAFTIVAVVRPNGGAGGYRSVVTSRGSTRGFILYANDTNFWDAWVGNTVNYNPASASTGAVTLNDTVVLIMTGDGTSTNLYLDGTLVQSYSKAYTPQTANPYNIGRGDDNGTDFQFLGHMAVHGIASRVVTSTERSALNSYLVARYGVT